MDANDITIIENHKPRSGGRDVVDAVAADERVRHTQAFDLVEVGQWYWYTATHRQWDSVKEEHASVEYEWLGCVVHVGSNYIKLKEPPHERSGSHVARIHFDDFWQRLRRENDPEGVIGERIRHFQGIASGHLAEIKAITARLGVSPQVKIGESAASGVGGRALMTLSGQSDIKDYERALVAARDDQLPKLFEKVKDANHEVARWMSAQVLPLEAMAEGMKSVVDEIGDRIFNVSLYAGLTEQVVRCCEGAPAAFHEKLHVMQLRQYMDEEGLMNYRHGGMEFKHIEDFDRWVSEPENRDRVLPFPRCLVAMRVRRIVKERSWDGTLLGAFIKISLAQSDKLTFLYIRNGERVYRLSCEMDFDEKVFPDRGEFDPAEPMMVKMSGKSVDKMITLADFEQRDAEAQRRRRLHEEWEAANPPETWNEAERGIRWGANPYRFDHFGFRAEDWEPFDPSSVYFDDIAGHVGDQIRKYNRVAVIVQGLFDRSDVLHPHPPVRTWTPDGFAAAIELVYDGSDVLHHGEAPDFDAYRARLNESLDANSVTIGQDDFWAEREAEKENRRIQGDWRNNHKHYHERFRPYGNPGPGDVARLAQWKPRSREAVYAWERLRQRDGDLYSGKGRGDAIRQTVTVPESRLFNVSAYTPGDYKRFFADRRTRAQYLRWAGMMLLAEEFHAGNEKAREPAT